MVLELLPVILQEKIVIRAKPANGFAWHPCVVCSVCNDKVELGLSQNLEEEIEQTGQKIYCKYSTEYFEYIMEGTVVNITPVSSGTGTAGKIALLSITRVDERINDRISSRFDVYIPAQSYSQWQPEKKDILIHNISSSGLSFISPTRFDTVEEYTFQILINKQEIELDGKIIRRFIRGDLFHYGVKFCNLSDKIKEHLLLYFDHILKEDEELREKFEAMYE